MSQNFIHNANFYLLLTQIDHELADTTLAQGCPFCQGSLHRADYPRSPLGIPSTFRDYFDSRLSFCCADCRKRTTPSSVRFFGRRWYPAPLLMLFSIFTLGINARRVAQIKRYFGLVVSETTWRRWRRWWRDTFTKTPFWQQAKGQLPPTEEIQRGPFPRVILDVLKGKLEEKIVHLLRWLAPLTSGDLRAV